MKIIMNQTKAIAVVTTALLLASLLWLMSTHHINNTLEAGLQNEKLKSEQLLSEKLLLEKEINKTKAQLRSLQGKNLTLDHLVKNTSARLNAQESEFKRLIKDNASLGQIKKQRQELIALQNQLQNELVSLKTYNAELLAKNDDLNHTIASLQERNKMLSDNLDKALFAAVDQSQIQAVKGKNERLTVRARKTKKLIADFEIPASLKKISFRVYDSKGNALQDGTIASNTIPSDNNLLASVGKEVQGNKLQKIEMTYTPKQKLKAGVYTVEVLNENLYVSSMKIRLK